MSASPRLDGVAVPVIGFCAPSGTGKTTLARHVVGLLDAARVRVGVLKQARDDFDVDQPGKDSHRLRQAGVERLLLGSERQSAFVIEHAADPAGNGTHAVDDGRFTALLATFDCRALDLILVEGFSERPFAKIELVRSRSTAAVTTTTTANGNRRRDGSALAALRYPDDPWVIAVACDDTAARTLPRPAPPRLDIDDPWAVAAFLCRYAGLPFND